jgi:hypothetical protein
MGQEDPEKKALLKYYEGIRCGTVFTVGDNFIEGPREVVQGATQDTSVPEPESEDQKDDVEAPSPTPQRASGRKRKATAAKREMDQQENTAKKRRPPVKRVEGNTIIVKFPANKKPSALVRPKTPKSQKQTLIATIITQNPRFGIEFDPYVDTIPGNLTWRLQMPFGYLGSIGGDGR